MTLDVILVQAGLGTPGGVTVDVFNLADGLEQRRQRPHPVGTLRELRRKLRSRPQALVHVFGCLPSPTTFGALTLARARALSLVWTPIFNPIRRHTWAGYGLLRVMELFDAVAPRAARFADAVIAATPSEAEYFAGLGARRVELIPPGVDPPQEPASAGELAAFRACLGLGSGPLVLIVGRDNSRKALPFGLAAFARVRSRMPGARLLLVGPDSSFDGGSGACCPGWLDQASMGLAYQAADVLFVPSLYEGLPRAVIEAWRWGTPVVATDRVALAPMIDGVGGRVIPYADAASAALALVALLEQPEAARCLGRAGQRLVESCFLLPDLVDRTLEVYCDLAGGCG
jgi:glycosyltransferase involved in cell wall biosynthesis